MNAASVAMAYCFIATAVLLPSHEDTSTAGHRAINSVSRPTLLWHPCLRVDRVPDQRRDEFAFGGIYFSGTPAIKRSLAMSGVACRRQDRKDLSHTDGEISTTIVGFIRSVSLEGWATIGGHRF